MSREQGAAKPARKRDVEEERFTLEWKVDVEEEVEEDVEGDAEDCCWGRTRLKTLEGLKRERYYL